jgi:hypothetical protein
MTTSAPVQNNNATAAQAKALKDIEAQLAILAEQAGDDAEARGLQEKQLAELHTKRQKILEDIELARQAEAAEKQKKDQQIASNKGQPKSAFTKHLQSLLIERIMDAKAVCNDKTRGASNLYTIATGFGPYTSNFMPGGSAISSFLQATPAQLASLQPLLRFYIVDNKGNEEEIYFADHVSAANIKDLANKRRAGDIQRSLPPKNKRGSNVGIKSFEWNYDNKHEGDRIIGANLEIYFGDMTELMNGNYLQFLFTTGLSDATAADIAKKKQGPKGSRKIVKTNTEVIKELTDSINKRKSALKKAANPDVVARRFFKDKKEEAAAAKRDFRQLKVVCGWSLPMGVDTSVFGGPKQYRQFREGIRRTQRAILLNLVDYNIDFQQEGTATLKMNYVGSTDNYLATNASDIFGSAEPAKTKTYFKKTEVTLTESGDTKQAKSLMKIMLGVQSKAPYLSKLGGMTTNEGDIIFPVTLGGIQFATQIANDERRLLEISKKSKNKITGKPTPAMNALNDRLTALVWLYKKALDLNTQELYTNFMRRIISKQNLMTGRVIIENGDSPDKSRHITKLAFGPDQIEEQKQIQLLKRQAKVFASETGNAQSSEAEANPSAFDPSFSDPLAGDTTSVTFYYMRFGDIIKAAMEQSSFRSDINLMMGNFRDPAGNVISIYDIPITLGTFGQFFFDLIASRQLSTMPFDRFFRSFLKVVANMMGYAYRGEQRLTFDFTTFNSNRHPGSSNKPLSVQALKNLGAGAASPLVRQTTKSGEPIPHQTYYALYSRRVDHNQRLGIREQDEAEGIYHYTIASDRGLAKTFNFARQDTKYFQEMLIESSNMENNIRALFLPQNVSIDMVGNGIHRNGDLIFVDSRAALGGWAGTKLGIGGYYRVIRSAHSISNRGYTTTLDCVFELRAPEGAARAQRDHYGGTEEMMGLLDDLGEDG